MLKPRSNPTVGREEFEVFKLESGILHGFYQVRRKNGLGICICTDETVAHRISAALNHNMGVSHDHEHTDTY